MKSARTSYYVLFFSLLGILPVTMRGQYFVNVYQTTYDKTAREVLPTADGGYILAGMTNTADPNDCNSYVMKTDAGGNKLWEKVYGGSKVDYPYSMIEASDGNYIITGYS